jgi:ABC-type thiamin/hydroxymethylpyrimidine transport system permease subunit
VQRVLRSFLFFSRKELAIILVVGLVTGLLDGRVETLEFSVVAHNRALVLLNDYLAFKTGGPVFGDLLETWLEYGAVLAACLVRKPAAGTIALTINGLCQVFAGGTHDPHLLYGVPGLGADIVFASFGYRRYDLATIGLAGIACAMFWYPIVWFTHGLYLYPTSFIASDFVLRVVGGSVGDGLLAGGVALLVLALAGRKWAEQAPPTLDGPSRSTKDANATGLLIISLGVLLIALTHASSEVANFFLSIGPKIPPGIATEEEYNPGYVIGVLIIFLVVVVLGFWNTRSLYSEGSASTLTSASSGGSRSRASSQPLMPWSPSKNRCLLRGRRPLPGVACFGRDYSSLALASRLYWA